MQKDIKSGHDSCLCTPAASGAATSPVPYHPPLAPISNDDICISRRAIDEHPSNMPILSAELH